MVWLTFVAACAGVAGAVIATVQARTAIAARRDAQAAEGAAVAARDAAVKAQQDSAAAAGRIAEALEQQVAAQRAAASVRPDPWELRPGGYVQHGGTLMLVHVGAHQVEDVSLEFERAPYMLHIEPNPVPTTFVPGDAVKVTWGSVGGDPPMPTLVVRWRWADSDETQTMRAPLA